MAVETDVPLLPCPFCGGEAAVEQVEGPHDASYSVGCNNKAEPHCVGFQCETTFARKSEAVAAWNRRHRVAQVIDHDAEDLTVAPGADDLTFGSVLSEMIRRSFQRVDGSAGPEARHYAECLHCQGNDAKRATGQRPSLEEVEHKPDCLLAKHLPRLRAMANKGVT